ncbi:MAG: SCO family protein, partial [Actinomycetota bacterium]|nr:SCO family protein [Actinomycetota bacterium]
PTVGYQLRPAPDVGSARLPDLTDGGRPFAFRAEPDSLLLVFFGFTNCPDICPTTMANVKFALGKLDDTADRIDVAMVTVDPERDLETLPAYVSDFVPTAHALGTADGDELLAAADAFGANYTIGTTPGGGVDVGHTPYLYGVDDEGRVAITWSNEVSSDDLVADIRHVLGADS